MAVTEPELHSHAGRVQTVTRAYPADKAQRLAAALAARIAGEVRFDDGSRALYATDGSNYRQVPIGVVIPKAVEDVIATVRICRDFAAPLLSRGGGTSLAGQCCNTAVVMDFSKYLHNVVSIDSAARSALVEPGCVLDFLRDAAERYHLTFGPDPATHDHNTLGGMIGNNSCGPHSVMAGRTSDNVEALEILTYDGERFWVGATSEEELGQIIAAGGRRGEIYRQLRDLRDRYADDIRRGYPQIPRRVSGYNLPYLLPERGCNIAQALVGSEGTCVVILQARLRLVHSPTHRVLVVLGFEDIYHAGDQVPQILEHRPIALEGLDDRLIYSLDQQGRLSRDRQLLPQGHGWLLAEIGEDDADTARQRAEALIAAAKSWPGYVDAVCLVAQEQQARVWKIRESGLAVTAFPPGQPDTLEGWEDSAVPPDRVGPYLRDFRKTLDRFGYNGSLYGHFGDGCIHTRIDFDLQTESGIQHYRRFVGAMADLVEKYGGSFSGEHGDGQSRAELLPKMFSPRLMQAMREFKAIWDPQWKMNPGKLVDPYPITSNLRFGTDFRPSEPATFYAYPEDHGSFVHAAKRCVGVGECRRHGGTVMCPSYMATWEEKHSTRGRARMLFEMLHGGPLTDGWKSEHVRDALDLCLACKGCKRDCPVGVDMATYKSEFMAHHYAGRLRPPPQYAMGLIHYWSRLAAKAPGLANYLTHGAGVSRIAKFLGGISQQRELPPYAAHTFKEWFQVRPAAEAGKPLILFADTFNNHFRPEIGKAAVEVLEWAGYRPMVPQQALCCARPMYDIGMLKSAKRLLRAVMDTLEPYVQQGIPVVGLEPACVASFRDELPKLFPHDPRARRLADHTFLFSEFLEKQADFEPPKLQRKAVLHAHCHHYAIIGTDTETHLLSRMELDF
ncbi:MAG TPA: FAD-binding and (Fe-S)-binding domain-containing protein, partial [Gammaproteobacteria bacterium]|nr:FAD-binding and (Fe-S)-binding domain-containing protein [Gammaproteobacteria bacterium]